ncbi:MAG TPA: sigma-70 family RNA polymerase sigma factor [Pseudonocardiaceae bacterium]|nr:sigma-70 family RNA polymerase sigma factor [Pseudonocardiaceae bacterium]
MTDAQLFRAMYEDCYPRVLAYAASVVGQQVGEDITSEVFIVAWRRWGELPSPPLPWLFGVTRNLIHEFRRRSARQYELAVADGRRLSTQADDGDFADDVTERMAVLRALAELSDSDRELLTLVAWHGLTTSEIAGVLNCSTATLSVRLHRARRRLAQAVEATFVPHPAARSDHANG